MTKGSRMDESETAPTAGDADRIERLKRALDAGTYVVNADRIAEVLIERQVLDDINRS